MSVSSNEVQPTECTGQDCTYRHKYTDLLRHFNIQTSELESLQRELQKASTECIEKDETIKKLGDRLHDVRKENEASTVRAAHRDELILSLRLELRQFYVAMAGVLRESNLSTRDVPDYCELTRCYDGVIKEVAKILAEKWTNQELASRLQKIVQHSSDGESLLYDVKHVSHEKFVQNLKAHVVSTILNELLPTPRPLDLSPVEPNSSSPELANFTNRSQPRRNPLNSRQTRSIYCKEITSLSDAARTPDCNDVATVATEETVRPRRHRGLSQATGRTLDMREPRVGQPSSRTRQQRDASLLPSHTQGGIKLEMTVLSPTLSGHVLRNIEAPVLNNLKAAPTLNRSQLNPPKSQRRKIDAASGTRGKSSRTHSRYDTHRRSCPSRRPDEPQLAAETNPVSLSPSVAESMSTAADSPKIHESPDRRRLASSERRFVEERIGPGRRSGRITQRGMNAPPICIVNPRMDPDNSGAAIVVASSRSSLPPTASHHLEAVKQQRTKGRSYSPIGGRTSGGAYVTAQSPPLPSLPGPRTASTRTSDYHGLSGGSLHNSLGMLPDLVSAPTNRPPYTGWAYPAKIKTYSEGNKWPAAEAVLQNKAMDCFSRNLR